MYVYIDITLILEVLYIPDTRVRSMRFRVALGLILHNIDMTVLQIS